jgi:integrase
MAEWTTLKSNGLPGGVRYRNHPTRKHGAVPDRYYQIRYRRNGKRYADAIGWASNGVTPKKCYDILLELHENHIIGKGPTTLAEKRLETKIKKEAEERRKAAAEKRTFKAFFYGVFLPNAASRERPKDNMKKNSNAVKIEGQARIWMNPVVGNMPFDKIGLTEIEQIRTNLARAGRSPRTQQYIFRTFAMVWNAAIDHELTEKRCPTKASSFKLPKVDNQRMRFLTEEEERLLLGIVRHKSLQAYQMCVVSLDAGLRWGEITRLTWGDVDLVNARLIILDPKTSDRIVPMPERLLTIFRSMPFGVPDKLVFPNHEGQKHKEPFWPIRTAFKESGLNDSVTNRKMIASFHTLRHTYASRLVQRGIDLLRVARLMGHSDIKMTTRYAKLDEKDLHEAVKVLGQNSTTEPPDPPPQVFKRSSNGKVIPFKKRA